MPLTIGVLLATVGITTIYIVVSFLITLATMLVNRKKSTPLLPLRRSYSIRTTQFYKLGFILLIPLILPIFDACLIDLIIFYSKNVDDENILTISFFLSFFLGWLISFTALFFLSNRFKELKGNAIISICLTAVTLMFPILFVLIVLPEPHGAEGAGGVAQGFAIFGLFVFIMFLSGIALIISTLISLWRISRFLTAARTKEESPRSNNADYQ